ncbi:cystathionine beta-synthase-like [Dysidea avara]|uniref:cystathionine beta-synthase-like n=1 Tax=Dysidea avara TaxID=196820 RepID=UPI003329CDAF
MALPDGYIPPNVQPKCSWSLGKRKNECPHQEMIKKPKNIPDQILPNVLEMIGQTPMIRLDKIAKAEGLKCDLLAKCEFFNASGSVKDRIGLRMVEEAERSGMLKPGDTLIEPTSGNTGISIALTAAVRGYKCVIVMPERMSEEKVSVIKALGAEIVRTPSAASFKNAESHFGVAFKLKNEIPNSHVLDQYRNAGNALAHYDGTGNEILEQTGGKVDMVIIGTGSGGTVCGVGRKIKEVYPNCKIVGFDPYGSLMAEPEELNKTEIKSYLIEGTGHDFIPTVLDRSVIDEWYKVDDKESFNCARRLIKEEGLLCGGTSGAALSVALRAAKNLKAGQKCVVLLPDSIRNYLSRFASDDWMIEHGFMDPPAADRQWWWDKPLTELKLRDSHISPDTTCSQAVSYMKAESLTEVPIVSDDRIVLGIAKLSDIVQKLFTGKCSSEDTVQRTRQYKKVEQSATLKRLYDMVVKSEYAVVVKPGSQEFIGVATLFELAEYSETCKK